MTHRRDEKTTSAVRRLRSYASVAVGATDLLQGRALGGPVYAQIGIADSCNHRCVMCPYHPPDVGSGSRKFGGDAPALMSYSRFGELVRELARLGTRRVDLVGRGEPMLHPGIIEMVDLACRLGLEVALTTNGSRLERSRVDGLVSAGLDWLKVSLNAGRPATYPRVHVTESEARYFAVLEGVRRVTSASRRRPHVTLSFAISSLNFEELDEMVRRAIEVGADAAYFQHLVPVPGRPDLTLDASALRRVAQRLGPAARELAARAGTETNLSSFTEEAERMASATGHEATAVPCYVGYYFTAVLGNGNVMPCCQIESTLGSLETASFANVWNSTSYRQFRRAARRLPVKGPELRTAECEHCYFRPHNLTVRRLVRPLGGHIDGAFSRKQTRRLTRLDPADEGER